MSNNIVILKDIPINTNFSLWNFIGIALVFIIIFILFLIYFLKIQKLSVKTAPSGYVLFFQIYIQTIKNLVTEILGEKSEKVTPFFIFLITYLIIANCLGILGIFTPTSTITVTFSLAFIIFIGTLINGIKFQRLSYLKNFTINIKIKKRTYPVMINPLKIIQKTIPIFSMSFRLWGNIFAGWLVCTLILYFFNFIASQTPVVGLINLFGGIAFIPFDAYFNLFCGLLQAFVFLIISLVYWKLERTTI